VRVEKEGWGCFDFGVSRLFVVIFLGGLCAHGQTVIETFGSGVDDEFTIEFVSIGNPGNTADGNGWGSVAYAYRMGKYEVSRNQITKANNIGSLGIDMSNLSSIGANGPNHPAVGINWFEAAKFVNFLNTEHGYAPAYKFDSNGKFQVWAANDSGYNPANPYRNRGSYFWLPSRDEWHKSAFGSPQGIWYDYPTGSDSRPSAVSEGTDPGTLVYNGASRPAEVQSAGGLSPWGTMAQGGNVYEWEETSADASNSTPDALRAIRSGSWYMGELAQGASSSYRNTSFGPQATVNDFGFRIASAPEPSSFSLLLAGGAVLMAGRRQR